MLQLVTLLPDMLLKLERIKADIVLQLVQDPEARCVSTAHECCMTYPCLSYCAAGHRRPPETVLASCASCEPPACLRSSLSTLTAQSGAQAVAKKLIRLREALPNTDISKLVARSPAVLLELTPATVAARVSQLRSALCSAAPSALLCQSSMSSRS